MKLIFYILLFNVSLCYAQEDFINSHNDIYIKEGLIYKIKDDKLFTGTISFIKKNGTILSKEIFKNGYKLNEYEYYNKSASGKVFKEIVYYKEKIHLQDAKFKIHKIILHHSNGQIYSVKHYDLDGDNILVEKFKDNTLTYSCEFKNGKKNGKEFCVTNDSDDKIILYSNGKKIN